jgi:hypothetical protein
MVIVTENSEGPNGFFFAAFLNFPDAGLSNVLTNDP